jgi:myo-inositol-1-phosphate synthase
VNEESSLPESTLGVWIVGALGDVATTAITGAFAIARGLSPATGMVTAQPAFQSAGLAPLSSLRFGGHDLRAGSPRAAAKRLQAELRCFEPGLLESVGDALDAVGAELRPGVSFGCSDKLKQSLPQDQAAEESSVSEALARLRADLRSFRERLDLDAVVVIQLSSTEPARPWHPAFDSLEALRSAIAADDRSIPASVLYATAAFEESCSYVNFTPCVGSNTPALSELAAQRGCCHAGQDGKTGETLLRTVLAPMFVARNLRVLSWSGFNLLGNRDGEVLSDPDANQAKTKGKDAVLRSILGGQLDDSLTRIDYVPSLKDFKTAWDLIHFQGFLGTKMSLQFTWQGADSALAAPLILDLVRLIDAARRAGRSGVIPELACFFKAPMGWAENAFPAQVERLHELLEQLRVARERALLRES